MNEIGYYIQKIPRDQRIVVVPQILVEDNDLKMVWKTCEKWINNQL